MFFLSCFFELLLIIVQYYVFSGVVFMSTILKNKDFGILLRYLGSSREGPRWELQHMSEHVPLYTPSQPIQ